MYTGLSGATSADMDKALEVAAKKDDVYYNRAKIIYNYALGKPEKVYKMCIRDRFIAHSQSL